MHINHLHSQFCLEQKTFKNNTPRTIHWLKEVFKYFIKQTNVTSINEINRHIVKQWFIQGQCQKNWSAKTIRTRMSALGLFFQWCVSEKYLDENPIKQLPKPKLEKRIPKHLTLEKASFILEWLKCYNFRYTYERARALAIFATFIYTGIRLQELLNLKFSDVQFEEKIIFIRSGKGNKDRTIPILSRLGKYLKDYVKERGRFGTNSVYFFVSIKKDGSMSYQVIKRLFTKTSKQTKIHIYPHLLRHSFAVQMLEGGCDIFTLSKLLGHSDIKTTTIYLTATNAQKQKQIEKHPLY
ncbi:tyrosine-type recombinase/integrase [Kordia sp.]|uniref:tyrosine-type recombinase/integrase n=1 Tax=Kordia sp. TaxID=1965332 RepID=UPI003D6BD319